MRRVKSVWMSGVSCLALWSGCALAVAAEAPVRLKVHGSTTVSPIATEAAEILRQERGWEIVIDTQGGSSGGLSALGDGLVDIGMISRPLTDEDLSRYPAARFHASAIGLDGVALIVSRPVWEAGVRALSKEEVQAIYEGRVTNWKTLGGPDAPIVFYDKEPGRGTWEVFADWAYGNHRQAPLASHPEVGGNEETRQKVASHPAAMSQLSVAWAESSDQVKILGIRLVDGQVAYPTREAIRNRTYPMARTLYLVTNGEAAGAAAEFIRFVLSKQGQAIVEKHGYLPIS